MAIASKYKGSIKKIICINRIKVFTLHSQKVKGSLAEWLGAGLQNRRRRFESARNLNTQKSDSF